MNVCLLAVEWKEYSILFEDIKEETQINVFLLVYHLW